MAGRNGTRIGIAVGNREVTGVILGKKGSPIARASLPPDVERLESGAEIRRALSEIKTALEGGVGGSTRGAWAHVAFLPPLADARVVPFPPMRKSEVETVLRRDVARYFLGANRPWVVSVRLPRKGSNAPEEEEGGFRRVLAAAAPLGLLEATRSALFGLGWRMASFTPAHGAWLDAASFRRGNPVAAVVAVVGDTAHVMRLEGLDPVGVRQVPASEAAAVAQAVGVGPSRVLVLADPPAFQEVSGPLAKAGMTVLRDPDGWPGTGEGTAARAAAKGLELASPAMERERREKGQKTTLSLVGGAILLILASMAAQLWGAHRELSVVQDRRASIQTDVAPLRAARDSLDALATEVRSLEDLARNSPVWTRSLVELTAILPRDTYLTGLFASGDTLEIEAAGAQAGNAIQALREAGLFEEVRLQGLVERELEDGETVVERFRLWARLPGAGGEVGGS